MPDFFLKLLCVWNVSQSIIVCILLISLCQPFSPSRPLLSLYLQEPEIESLAAIESELENVAQKLHELRRGWEKEKRSVQGWHHNLLCLFVLLRFTSCLVSTDRVCEYVTRFYLLLFFLRMSTCTMLLQPLLWHSVVHID